MVVYIDPQQPTRAFALGYALLATYLLVSLALVVTSWRSWWWDYRLAPPALVLDVITFLAAVFFTEAADDFTSPFLSFFAFLMLSATIRWDWRATVVTALVVTGLYLLLGLFIAGLDPNFDTYRFGRRIIYMLVLSLVVAWFGLQRGAITIERFVEFVDPARDESALMNDALQHALAQTGARRGVIAWETYEEPDVRLLGIGLEVPAERLGPLGFESARAFASEVRLFDRPKRRSLHARRNGRPAVVRDAPDDALATFCDIDTGLAFPLAGLTGRGEIILCDIAGIGADHVELGKLLTEDISDAFDRRAAFMLANESALARIRDALARDLHDTLAQSLAGTSLRLEGLKNWIRSGGDPDSEIETIKGSLREEQHHVRDLIARLRMDPRDTNRIGLEQSARTLLDALAVRWGVAIQLEANGDSPEVTEGVAHDVSQLLREAVANAVRHGRADRISVALGVDQGNLSIVVQDNGTGFPAELAERHPRSIEQRLGANGGKLEISSRTSGCRLAMILPLGGEQ